MSVEIIHAPGRVPSPPVHCFLSGSMGDAPNWQDQLTARLQTRLGHLATKKELLILNPRRDDWDSSWERTPDNPEFKKQAEWRLDNLLNADLIAMYFAPNTKSSITLLDFGLCVDSGSNLIICCPPGFWQRGHIQIICARREITLFSDFEAFSEDVGTDLEQLMIDHQRGFRRRG